MKYLKCYRLISMSEFWNTTRYLHTVTMYTLLYAVHFWKKLKKQIGGFQNFWKTEKFNLTVLLKFFINLDKNSLKNEKSTQRSTYVFI